MKAAWKPLSSITRARTNFDWSVTYTTAVGSTTVVDLRIDTIDNEVLDDPPVTGFWGEDKFEVCKVDVEETGVTAVDLFSRWSKVWCLPLHSQQLPERHSLTECPVLKHFIQRRFSLTKSNHFGCERVVNSLQPKALCSFEQIGHFGLYGIDGEVVDKDDEIPNVDLVDFWLVVRDLDVDFSTGFGLVSVTESSTTNERIWRNFRSSSNCGNESDDVCKRIFPVLSGTGIKFSWHEICNKLRKRSSNRFSWCL